MLKIRKDGVEKIVTSGVFENLFKDMGYEIVNEKSVEKVATPDKEVAPKTEIKVELPKSEEPKSNKKVNK